MGNRLYKNFGTASLFGSLLLSEPKQLLVPNGNRPSPLSRAGFSWSRFSAIDSNGRTIWIVDAHGYGKRFIVRAEEIVTAFLELERAVHEFAVSLIS